MKMINKEIILGKSCFIIAEAGVNHNGRIDLAKKLIDAAKTAGADAIKFQTFTSKNLVTRTASMAEYQEKNTNKSEKQYDMISRLELSYKQFLELKKYCDKKEILFLSTPHTQDTLEFLNKIIPIFKVGSGDLTNIPFLKEIAKKGKPIILSTGMSNMQEISDAINAIKEENNNKIAILHCTTSYPCPLKDVNLSAMKTLMNKFPYPVGYSDHTIGLDTSQLAVREGATIIERHLTLDKNLDGPDHKASLEPEELKTLILLIRNNKFNISQNNEKIIMGSPEKKPTEEELKIQKIARKSVVAAKRIKKGEIITSKHLIIKRPGTGLKPVKIYDIIGSLSTRNISKDEMIKESDYI